MPEITETRTIRLAGRSLLDHQVIIAGGGPTGLMLAGELALAGIDVLVIEKRGSQELAGLRAGGLHIRTIEVLDQRGIADRFISQGQVIFRAPFARKSLDLSDLPTRHNYFLALWQTLVERTLSDWLSELKVPVKRGSQVTDLAQDENGVEVTLSDGYSLHAEYLVGCDGGSSLVRKRAGVAFPGHDPTTSWLIAEIETADEPEWGIRPGPKGISAIAKLEGDEQARVVVNEQEIQREQPTLADVREALRSVYGTDFGLRNARYISRFTDMTRQAASYWTGRILLAGDAAHVHAPAGGQGLNLGIQDAVNLGWKLAQVLHRTSPASLLATYHFERYGVGARVLRNTMALTAMERDDVRTGALREMICELLENDHARMQYVAMTSGLDIRYEPSEGHPLLGRRIPDIDMVVKDGTERAFTLLHKARPVLLSFGQTNGFDVTPWADRVQHVAVRYDGNWDLPGIGPVVAPPAALVRPDGYVAWVGDQSGGQLEQALTRWFGPPTHP